MYNDKGFKIIISTTGESYEIIYNKGWNDKPYNAADKISNRIS